MKVARLAKARQRNKASHAHRVLQHVIVHVEAVVHSDDLDELLKLLVGGNLPTRRRDRRGGRGSGRLQDGAAGRGWLCIGGCGAEACAPTPRLRLRMVRTSLPTAPAFLRPFPRLVLQRMRPPIREGKRGAALNLVQVPRTRHGLRSDLVIDVLLFFSFLFFLFFFSSDLAVATVDCGTARSNRVRRGARASSC